MEVVLVRHGETEWSRSGRHTSRTDLPLLDEGRVRAREIGIELSGRQFSVVLCSPLLRALETCGLAGFRPQAELSDDLREWDYGDYEGLTTEEIRRSNPDWVLWRDGCPEGESPDNVRERANRVVTALRESDGDAILFAHGHILRVITALWIRMEVPAGARLALSAGGVSVLGYERENEVVRRWNV